MEVQKMITMKRKLSSLNKGKEEFIADCKIRNLAKGTISIYEEDFNYFMKNGYINNEFKIEQIKEEKGIPELYTKTEIQKLLKKPNLKTCTFAKYRT